MRLVWITGLIFLLGLAAPVSADVKIGYVNSSMLLERAPQAEAATINLEREFADRERAIRQAQQEIQELENALNRDAITMSESERSQKEQEINRKVRDLHRMQSNFRDDLNLRKNEELGRLQRLVLRAIREVAQTQGYDLVLSEGVVYSADRVDLTDEVLTQLQGMK